MGYFAEVAAGAELLDDVVVIAGLDDVRYFDDIGVVEGLVDRNLQLQSVGAVLVGFH
jgi:hypothetical protein